MVYTISDRVDKVYDLGQQVMDSKFQRVRTKETEDEYGPNEKWRVWKNVLVLGFAFMLHFTAFWGASNLQSSINADQALGTFTLAAIYGSLILSNILLPSFVIKLLGCKWTMCFALITYMPFIMAQFYPKFYTMIPAGLAVGLGGGPLWCAKCTYLTVVSRAYNEITGIAIEINMTKFFGIFFMFYELSQVWGNLISSAVLLSDGTETVLGTTNQTTVLNITTLLSNTIVTEGMKAERSTDICGAKFCTRDVTVAENPNLAPPEMYKIHRIAGIYLACMILATLIIAFGVDPISRYTKKKADTNRLSTWKLLAVTFNHLSNRYQLLIIPIMMFIGAEQAFIAADYNAAFVSCGWGIENIGFVMICFGVCNAIASSSSGALTKIFGRNLFMCGALALHAALIIVLLVWQPGSRNQYIYFLLSGLWGVCDAIWLVQIHTLSGMLFAGKEEAAYSHFRLWEALGSVITYVYSPYLCTSVKLYLLLGLLIIAISGYTIIEYLESKKKAITQNNELDARGKFTLIDNKVKTNEATE